MEKIIVLDFGGQYNQLIVRRIREAGVYCEIFPCDTAVDTWKGDDLKGIILTGGPQSVYDEQAKACDPVVLSLGVPVLGICYGQQWMTHMLGGKVGPMDAREYGSTDTMFDLSSALFKGLPERNVVWMNHNDAVTALPDGFFSIAHTKHCACAAIANPDKRYYGVQFHPEVAHTQHGSEILKNFLNICGCQGGWEMEAVVDSMVEAIRKQVGDSKVLCALSGLWPRYWYTVPLGTT